MWVDLYKLLFPNGYTKARRNELIKGLHADTRDERIINEVLEAVVKCK